MFDRYTTHARRAIFFSRYEAGAYRSDYIDTEHVLLGILREDRVLRDHLPAGAMEEIRARVEQRHPQGPQIPTSVDLPLSRGAKQALKQAEKERKDLGHKYVDAGHLVLGLLRVENCSAAVLLREQGIEYAGYRAIVNHAQPPPPPT